MKRLLVVAIALLASGCSSFPVADVRHSHATVVLVSGARAIPAESGGDVSGYMAQKTGFSHIIAGDRVVLVAMDSDARPDWIDSGTGEDLVVELPTLSNGTQCAVGQGSRIWFWRMSAWGIYPIEDVRGCISVRERGASTWAIDVEVTGVLREAHVVAQLRHTFTLTPISFEDFKRRYPPQTGWTR